MSLSLGKNNKVMIIDRTIPEILTKKGSMKRLETVYFCWMLKEIGVDFIEIDAEFLKLNAKLPVGLDFMLRIRSKEDIFKCVNNGIKKCIVPEELLADTDMIAQIKSYGIKIMVEVSIEKIGHIERIRKLSNLEEIDEIRLTGMDAIFSLFWIDKVKSLAKALNKGINICPQNTFYNATALCVEGVMNGLNSITVSFLGYGQNNEFAALEEVLAAVKVLVNPNLKLDLTKLPELAGCFTSLTGKQIPDNKPIVGKGIFYYQAGIHADGIEKDPLTYEPFDPSMVGLTRTLTIGKHSGRRAVQRKLKELGIACKVGDAAQILKTIREKSTQYKRDLFDEEILDIYKSLDFIR